MTTIFCIIIDQLQFRATEHVQPYCLGLPIDTETETDKLNLPGPDLFLPAYTSYLTEKLNMNRPRQSGLWHGKQLNTANGPLSWILQGLGIPHNINLKNSFFYKDLAPSLAHLFKMVPTLCWTGNNEQKDCTPANSLKTSSFDNHITHICYKWKNMPGCLTVSQLLNGAKK